MALVAPERLLPELPEIDPRLLDRAAVAGRVRGAVVDTWAAIAESPGRADPLLRKALREARHLHSRERRFVGDALYGFLRYGRWLAAVAGSSEAAAWLDVWIAWHRAGAALPALPADDAEALALLGSLDPALARHLASDLPDPVGFLAASNHRAPVTVRANRTRCTREALAERLAAEGVQSQPTRSAPHGLILATTVDIHTLASFRDGWFEVQDEGSQLVGELAEGPGNTVDWCAGAGGKALQLAASGADVLALDVRPHALDELSKRARRAGARLRTAVLPTRVPAADTVLVDAPCTGTGTLRRHPELRLRIDGRSIAGVTAEQRQILDEAAESVRPGGRLVYVTCSVLKAENEAIVEGFLAGHPDFSAAAPPLRLSPDVDGTDGFFGQVLRRV